MLTPRERDVFCLLLQGKTHGEIARDLYLSKNTAREYIARLYTKLGVNRRSALVAKAMELGILEFYINL